LLTPSIPDIARELHVDAVLEGAVTRVQDRVRITVQGRAPRRPRRKRSRSTTVWWSRSSRWFEMAYPQRSL